ncbi:MAG: hypothetical protein ACYSWW_15315 [Planctomycetota bacterium]|jgi:membrane-bound metal-dependent hydrolase YbcI (DUF457 family)
MPFTPYHFGPSGFVGLVFRKWIDVPVFVLANVIVDFEVLAVMMFGLGPPHHRYFHTLLIGALVGAMWGAAAYPLRHLLKTAMNVFCVPYRPRFWKMVVSGILGAWMHVLVDGAYHTDVEMFWPNETISLWRAIRHDIDRQQIETICVAFFASALIPYMLAMIQFNKNHNEER